MKICATDASCRKSGLSIASYNTFTEQSFACRSHSRPRVLSSVFEVVQTYTYVGSIWILEAPIAPELSGRISRCRQHNHRELRARA